MILAMVYPSALRNGFGQLHRQRNSEVLSKEDKGRDTYDIFSSVNGGSYSSLMFLLLYEASRNLRAIDQTVYKQIAQKAIRSSVAY